MFLETPGLLVRIEILSKKFQLLETFLLTFNSASKTQKNHINTTLGKIKTFSKQPFEFESSKSMMDSQIFNKLPS